MAKTNFNEIALFDDVTYETLLREIYTKNKKKSNEIEEVLKKLVELIMANPSQAGVLMPNVTEYSEISIKNDAELIKLAGIIQRFYNKGTDAESDTGSWNLPQHEIDQLLAEPPTPILQLDTIEIKGEK